ncbi:uncharacterized protein LOC110266329 [Arachis ipaensis]|uniref:uncharacterized protein LOC110266329 n=1 Tax=Arachis ipaensis TaxID=130454 RepID=UPI000A2B5AFE|nr:uncharacterized protein LOC110266329 [Arachis ipaensis]
MQRKEMGRRKTGKRRGEMGGTAPARSRYCRSRIVAESQRETVSGAIVVKSPRAVDRTPVQPATAAPSSPPRPCRVAAVALTASPPSSSQAWRKHSAAGFVGLPPSNLSLPPLLAIRTERERICEKGAAAGFPLPPRGSACRCGGLPPFLHRRRKSITGAAGLSVCCCGVAGASGHCAGRRRPQLKPLASWVLIVVSCSAVRHCRNRARFAGNCSLLS